MGIYDKIPPDPDLESVDAATEAATPGLRRTASSAWAAAVSSTRPKAVCVTLKNGGKANDHLNLLVLTEPQTPHIAIPTTSGTGSEVTNVAVLTSKGAGRKLFIVDARIMPNVAILDPRFTMTLPKGLTVATAMDAMTHAIEAMTSTMSNPICDGMAIAGHTPDQREPAAGCCRREE